ncbi:MAG: glycosyltransferase [Microthrixaceae bacterium]
MVFAGSLGARRINEAVAGLVEAWADRSDLFVYHVIGRRDFESFTRPELPDGAGIEYRAVEYESNMPRVLAASDLAICRAGGTSVAELAAIGVPAILVPLPIATRDHQRFNAEALVAAGGAVLVDDAACTADRLADELRPLLDPPGRLAEMAAAARSVGRPDAASAVADLIEEHAR